MRRRDAEALPEVQRNTAREKGTRELGIDRAEFLRRVRYMRGHLDAVVRMMEEGRDCGEVLRQMRAVRRAAEKLEVQCLLSHLAENVGPVNLSKIVRLYRLAHR